MLGDLQQVTSLVITHTGQDAELVQVFAITHRKSEDAHRKRHILLIVIQSNDHIVQRVDHALDVVIEIHAVDIQVMQCNGCEMIPLLFVI